MRCSQDLYFETETWSKLRDRDFIKYTRLETWVSRSHLKICVSCRYFSKKFPNNVITTSKLKFCRISGSFPTCFGCFLSANTADRNPLNYRSFSLRHILAIFKVSRQQACDRDLWSLRRDLKPSRPRYAKMGPEANLKTVTKSWDSITATQIK